MKFEIITMQIEAFLRKVKSLLNQVKEGVFHSQSNIEKKLIFNKCPANKSIKIDFNKIFYPARSFI